MANEKKVYWNDTSQRIRWTTNSSYDDLYQYNYGGLMNRTEFDLLIEALFEKYGDNKMSNENIQEMYDDIRKFCDKIKGLVE